MAKVTKEEIEDRLDKARGLIDKDDPKKASKELKEIIKRIPDDIVFSPLLIESHLCSALAFCNLAEFDQALEHILKAIELAENTKNDRLLAVALHQHCHILLRTCDYDLANEQVNRSLEISRQIKDQAIEGIGLMELSNVLYVKKEIEKGLATLRESVLLLEKVGDKRNIARAYNNFASYIHLQGDKERSIEYFDKTIAMSKKAGAIRFMGLAMMNKASVLIELNRHDEAMKVAEESLNIFEQVGDRYLMATSTSIKGLAHAEKEEWVEAEDNIHKARLMVKKIGMPSTGGVILFEIGKVYMLKGDKERGLRHINEAMAILKEQNSIVGQKMIQDYLDGLEKDS